MTQPDAIEALTAQLRADIDAIHAQILAEITAAAAGLYQVPVAVRVARLRTLEQAVLALADQADAVAAVHVSTAVQGAYEIGSWTTAITTGAGATFGTVDIDAVTHIAADTMNDLLHATKGVREDTKTLIRELVRDRIRTKVYIGQTAVQAGKDLAAELATRGVTSVTYANGARVSLPQYTQMVVRTKTAEAYQEGGMNQGERLGIDWWEIMDGPGCGWSGHEDPQTADGMIVTLAIAREHPTSHPNCRRSSSPRPDISSAREAAKASPTPSGDVTQAQAAAVAAQERARRVTAVAVGSGARASAGLDLQAGTVVSAAQARFVALTA